MTSNEAYKILGVSSTSSIDQIEVAYKTGLRKCQLQLVPGQPLATRQDAQDRIVAIQQAWQLLKKLPPRKSTAQPVNTHHTRRNYFVWSAPFRLSPRTVGILVALVLMVSISVICAYSSGHKASVKNNETTKTYAANSAASEPVIACNPLKAQLRILAVPWCYVEIDDKSVGTSGQLEPFEVSDGAHKINFRRGNVCLSRVISCSRQKISVIRVIFTDGVIDVD